ncbi:MAG: dihydroxyacetone kinase subunit L, partial [Actinomycetota bacterium]|nr:dihydroxyacetone kinase subunit L [Actinomycetota bacterium]
MDAATVKRWLEASAAVLHEQRDYLTQLDAAIGDADHGTNMDRGFSSVVATFDDLDESSPPGRI